jgi:hypothetical protein
LNSRKSARNQRHLVELISRTVHGTYWGKNLRVLFTFIQGITS